LGRLPSSHLWDSRLTTQPMRLESHVIPICIAVYPPLSNSRRPICLHPPWAAPASQTLAEARSCSACAGRRLRWL
jgi:hypothetical protein